MSYIILALGLILFLKSLWIEIFSFMTPGDENAMIFGIILIIIGLIGAVRRKFRNSAKIAEAKFEVDLVAEGYQYTFRHKGTGISVSPQNKTIRLQENGKVKIYPFNMIRSWEANFQSGGMAVGTGVAVATANLGTMRANEQSSGLFVYTKDVENAVWRIGMLTKSDQAKWMEILQQNLNES